MQLGHLMESWTILKCSCNGIVAWKKVSVLDEELEQSLARYFVLRANFKLYIFSKHYKINK